MKVAVPIDADEALEAAAVFDRWASRLDQLPHHLREAVLALAAQPESATTKLVRGAGGMVCELTPQARALVAMIRAHEGQVFP